MDALEALRTRRSVRVFDDSPVDRTLIEDIVDCGRLAATARNEQPWEFVAILEARSRERIAALTNYGKFIAKAPVCIAVFCKEADYYLEDGCAATQNMLVAARALGLGSCWVAGERKPYGADVAQVCGMPPGHKLISLIALGYSTQQPKLPKRSLEEVLHWEHYSE
jgi:nitroreductase